MTVWKFQRYICTCTCNLSVFDRNFFVLSGKENVNSSQDMKYTDIDYAAVLLYKCHKQWCGFKCRQFGKLQ